MKAGLRYHPFNAVKEIIKSWHIIKNGPGYAPRTCRPVWSLSLRAVLICEVRGNTLWVRAPAGDLHVKRTAVHSSSRFCPFPLLGLFLCRCGLAAGESDTSFCHGFTIADIWSTTLRVVTPRSNVSGGALSGAGAERGVGCDFMLESLWRPAWVGNSFPGMSFH